MIRTIAEILDDVKENGELEDLAAGFAMVDIEFSSKSQSIAEEKCRDGAAFVFSKRVYIRWNGKWYDGTNHPRCPKKPGYHIKAIQKRNYGSFGKIMEELEELNDAHEQGSKIMQLVELADLYGAIEGYLQERFPGMEMHDLKKFSDITKRAFKNGHRG